MIQSEKRNQTDQDFSFFGNKNKQNNQIGISDGKVPYIDLEIL
jgi:hypothetical protein